MNLLHKIGIGIGALMLGGVTPIPDGYMTPLFQSSDDCSAIQARISDPLTFERENAWLGATIIAELEKQDAYKWQLCGENPTGSVYMTAFRSKDGSIVYDSTTATTYQKLKSPDGNRFNPTKLETTTVLGALIPRAEAAIALDTSLAQQVTTATSLTYSYTTTGTNPITFIGTTGGTANDFTSLTYNSVASSDAGSTVGTDGFYSNLRYVYGVTGAQNVVVTFGSSQTIVSMTSSFTGATQGAAEVTNTNTGASGTSSTCTVTTTTANDWIVGYARSIGGSMTAGTATTIRVAGGDSRGLLDSNGARAAGSNSLITDFVDGGWETICAGIAPVASAVATQEDIIIFE